MSGRYRTIVADPPWPYDDQPMRWKGKERASAFLPYPTMTVEDIAALPVASLGVADAHLYLWTTQRFLWTARDIAKGWGFTVEQVLTWCKEPMGRTGGGAFCNSTEFFLFCRRDFGALMRRARMARGLNIAETERLVRGGLSTGLGSRWEEGSSWPNDEHLEGLRRVLTLDDEWSNVAGNPRQHDTTWFRWPRGKHSAKPDHFYDLVEQVSPPPYLELFARRQRLGWDTYGLECFNHVELAEAAV